MLCLLERGGRIEASKTPVFKGAHDAQKVENFLWHLENHFKCNKLKSDEIKINIDMLYLMGMEMLW